MRVGKAQAAKLEKIKQKPTKNNIFAQKVRGRRFKNNPFSGKSTLIDPFRGQKGRRNPILGQLIKTTPIAKQYD